MEKRSRLDKQINREAEPCRKKKRKKNQDDRRFQLDGNGEEKSSQWNSSNINRKSSTAGSHYVGETQVSANLTSDCLSMRDRTPLITPWGPCHLLKLESLTLVRIDLVIWCYGFDLYMLNCAQVSDTEGDHGTLRASFFRLLVVGGCRCLPCVGKCIRTKAPGSKDVSQGGFGLPHNFSKPRGHQMECGHRVCLNCGC